jgi:hypothetical protein
MDDSPFRLMLESGSRVTSAITFARQPGVDKETMVSNCCHEVKKQNAMLRQEIDFKGEQILAERSKARSKEAQF